VRNFNKDADKISDKNCAFGQLITDKHITATNEKVSWQHVNREFVKTEIHSQSCVCWQTEDTCHQPASVWCIQEGHLFLTTW